jgi:hypothetical protein
MSLVFVLEHLHFGRNGLGTVKLDGPVRDSLAPCNATTARRVLVEPTRRSGCAAERARRKVVGAFLRTPEAGHGPMTFRYAIVRTLTLSAGGIR